MSLLAQELMDPGGFIAWLLVGLIAGWLAGLAMKGGGYGVFGDIVVGLVGAVIGGMVFGFLAPGIHLFWGSVVVAFIGACILIALFRLVTGTRPVA